MQLSCKLKYDRHTIELSSNAAILLIETHQRCDRSRCGDAEELATTSGLVICQQIRWRLILLKVGLKINLSSACAQRCPNRSVNLFGQIQGVNEDCTGFRGLNRHQLWSRSPGHTWIRRGCLHSDICDSVSLIQKWQWGKLLHSLTPKLTEAKWSSACRSNLILVTVRWNVETNRRTKSS